RALISGAEPGERAAGRLDGRRLAVRTRRRERSDPQPPSVSSVRRAGGGAAGGAATTAGAGCHARNLPDSRPRPRTSTIRLVGKPDAATELVWTTVLVMPAAIGM